MKSFRIQAGTFWKVFFQEEKNLRQLLDHENDHRTLIEYKMKQVLDICLSDCAFTIAKKPNGRYELVLSPQKDKLFILYLRYLTAQVPKTLLHLWDFYYANHPCEDRGIKFTVRDQTIGFADIQVYPTIKDQSFALEIYADVFRNMRKEDHFQKIYELLDSAIGEIPTMYWIQSIRFLKKRKSGGIRMDQLSDYIKETIEKQHWMNVSHPLQVYSAYTVLPRRRDFHLRNDVYSGISSQTALIAEMNRYDDTHVRWGEANGIIIGFVFYEHMHLAKGDRIIVRENLEEKLNHCCEIKQAAENIGAANGLFYTYLDYVVYDWELFVKILNEVMEDVNTQMYGFQYMISGEQPLYLVNNKPSGQG